MKFILILLIVAGCGYGAYSHLETQEKRIAEADISRRKSEAEKADLLHSVESLTAKVNDTCSKFEAIKTRRLETITREMSDDFTTRKTGLESELNALRDGLNPQKIAEAKAELKRLEIALQKAATTNESLLKYVRAEEAAARTSYPGNTATARVRFNNY